MKSKSIGLLSVSAVVLGSALMVLGGLASLSSAASGGPTVVLSSPSATTTSATSIPITATFSESVNGLASTSVTATNATVSAVAGTGAVYTFTLTPIAQGTVTVMLAADVASSTASSTGSQASNTLTFTYDSVAPVIAQVTGIASTTASSSPTFVFSSTEAGTTTLSGAGCSASTTPAVVGSNTVQFNSLPNGSYTCSLTVADAAGNTSNVLPINFTVSVPPPLVAPVISGVAVSSISTSTATITWTTDASSTSQVFYGTSSAYGSSSALNATQTTSHSVLLTGLSEATLYHFDVASTNAGGTATSSDAVFTTQSTASSTPLLVTSIDTVRGTATADGVFADGWEWILHLVVPDVENNFAMRFTDFTSSSSSSTVPAANNIRIFSSQSSNASTTSSALVETGNGYSADMHLNGDTSGATPGRQIDVHVQVAVPAGTPSGGPYTTTFGALSTTTPF